MSKDVTDLEARLAGIAIGSRVVSPGTFLRRRGPIQYVEEGATPHQKTKDQDWSPATTPATVATSKSIDSNASNASSASSEDDAAFCRRVQAGFEKKSSPIAIFRGDNEATPGALRYVTTYHETPVTDRSDDSLWTPSNKENFSPATTISTVASLAVDDDDNDDDSESDEPKRPNDSVSESDEPKRPKKKAVKKPTKKDEAKSPVTTSAL